MTVTSLPCRRFWVSLYFEHRSAKYNKKFLRFFSSSHNDESKSTRNWTVQSYKSTSLCKLWPLDSHLTSVCRSNCLYKSSFSSHSSANSRELSGCALILLIGLMHTFKASCSPSLSFLATRCCLCSTQCTVRTAGTFFLSRLANPLYRPTIAGAPSVAAAVILLRGILCFSKYCCIHCKSVSPFASAVRYLAKENSSNVLLVSTVISQIGHEKIGAAKSCLINHQVVEIIYYSESPIPRCFIHHLPFHLFFFSPYCYLMVKFLEKSEDLAA